MKKQSTNSKKKIQRKYLLLTLIYICISPVRNKKRDTAEKVQNGVGSAHALAWSSRDLSPALRNQEAAALIAATAKRKAHCTKHVDQSIKPLL